jgi:hypothetical protein
LKEKAAISCQYSHKLNAARQKREVMAKSLTLRDRFLIILYYPPHYIKEARYIASVTARSISPAKKRAW